LGEDRYNYVRDPTRLRVMFSDEAGNKIELFSNNTNQGSKRVAVSGGAYEADWTAAASTGQKY